MAEKSAPPTPAEIPESQHAAKIALLQEQLNKLEGEVKVMEGRYANRNPAVIEAVQAENKSLRKRMERLESALWLLTREASQGIQPAELKAQTEVLRLAAIDYCKKNNINPELWKNIVS